MTKEINQRQLRNDSGRIMREVDKGETFVVTRNGVPVGELSPLHRSRFLPAESAIALFQAAPPLDYDRFREDLDAVTDQVTAPRA